MDKELFKMIVLHLTKCEKKTNKVLKIVYSENIKKSEVIEYTCSSGKKTKKDELMESLIFLKSKKTKTKKDLESIGILESVIKNM
jgi:phosphoribosylpyrophosphate synthetase